MAKPMVVSLSHELGKAEAIRRIRDGVDYIKARHAAYITVKDATWDGDRLNFTITALKQTASGVIDVEDHRVTIAVTLPMLLAMVAEKARSLIQKEGTLLLEKK